MKNKFYYGFITIVLIGIIVQLNARGFGMCWAEPPLEPMPGYPETITPVELGYFETVEKIYRKNTCYAGYRKLKKEMRQEAARFCMRENSSPRYNPLKCLNYKKISCAKHRRPHHQTTVTVKVRLYTYCR